MRAESLATTDVDFFKTLLERHEEAPKHLNALTAQLSAAGPSVVTCLIHRMPLCGCSLRGLCRKKSASACECPSVSPSVQVTQQSTARQSSRIRSSSFHLFLYWPHLAVGKGGCVDLSVVHQQEGGVPRHVDCHIYVLLQPVVSASRLQACFLRRRPALVCREPRAKENP